MAAATALFGCNGTGDAAGTAGGGGGNTVSKSKDAEIRKGMQNYPKTIDEVPPQYRQMVLDAEKMKQKNKAPDAVAVQPKK